MFSNSFCVPLGIVSENDKKIDGVAKPPSSAYIHPGISNKPANPRKFDKILTSLIRPDGWELQWSKEKERFFKLP